MPAAGRGTGTRLPPGMLFQRSRYMCTQLNGASQGGRPAHYVSSRHAGAIGPTASSARSPVADDAWGGPVGLPPKFAPFGWRHEAGQEPSNQPCMRPAVSDLGQAVNDGELDPR